MGKKLKQRPPRIYRTKDGRPYIKVKGKRAYLNFGKKTNDLSTLQIVKLFMKYLGRPKRAKTKKEDKKKVQSLSEIEQNTRTVIQDHLDKLKQEKYDLIEAIDKKEKAAREEAEAEKKRQERKDLADATERKEILAREHKKEMAEAKARQEEKEREMEKEQRLIQELNAERRHRQGLLAAPLAPPMIQPHPSGRTPKKTASSTVIIDVTDKMNKQAKDFEDEKRKRIIDSMFTETMRLKRKRAGKTKNRELVNKLLKAGIDIKILKPKGKKKNYSETLKQWLYTQKFTEKLTSPEQGWDAVDKLVNEKKTTQNKQPQPAPPTDAKTQQQQAQPAEEKQQAPPTEEEEQPAEEEQQLPPHDTGLEGSGYKGLMTDEINEIMKKHKWFLGTVASDQLNTLNPGSRKRYGFIMNLDRHNQGGSHWIAVWISLNGDRAVEVYDPLAEYEPTELFQQQMKQLLDKSRPDSYLLMKVNQVKQQSDTSDTCGWHSMRFLLERAKGIRFKFASGWTDLKEKEAEELKSQNGYGFDTYI